MFDLTGRTALVTGAGQGVGAAIARTLAAHGALVAVNDIAVDRALKQVAAIGEAGGQAVPAVADLTDRAAVLAMVEQVGPVDILVNNAGVPPSGLRIQHFIETDPAEWAPVVDLNLYGVLNVTHAAVGGMVEREWGRVVTIVSDAGRTGEIGIAVYGAAKAAAAGFARSLAKEVGPAGVTSNCVSLGAIHPDGVPLDEIAERRAKRYPMRRLGRADDVAPAVLWLASEEAGWVTGQVFSVSGGYVTS